MKIDLADPTAVLVAASQALKAAGLSAAAYGGLALAMYGEPRETKDADLAVFSVSSEQAETAFRAAGFTLLRAFDRMTFGGQLVSRLTLIGGTGGSLNTVDLVEPRSDQYAEDVQARALDVVLRDQPVRVVSPEDFVVLKVLATRERDLEDARTVLRALTGRLDGELIKRVLAGLSRDISDFDFMSRWRALES